MQVSVKTNETNNTNHESRKPAEMLIKLIMMYSNESEYVIDPFLGSGTTLFAAEKLQRICIGGELNKDYCNEIIIRWNNSNNDKAEKI